MKGYKHIHPTKEELEDLYINKKMSEYDIAQRYGCSQTTISHHLDKLGIPRRTISEANIAATDRGKRKGHWEKDGYTFIHDPKTRKPTRIHRFIMEKYLKRKLGSDEVVHHLNGNRSDNRIDNLTAIKKNQHGKWTYVKKLQKRIRELEANQSCNAPSSS